MADNRIFTVYVHEFESNHQELVTGKIILINYTQIYKRIDI